MPQYVTTQTQTVAAGQSVVFTGTRVPCNNGLVLHSDGSSIIKLRAPSNCCRARYKVTFTGNIAVATGGIVGPISIAITVDGEPLYSATGTVTPAAIGDFFNVAVQAYIDVPSCCCVAVSVRNVINSATPTATATPIDVANGSIIITREA